jgi:hypothetical protein
MPAFVSPEAPVAEQILMPADAPIPEIAPADGQTMACLLVTPDIAHAWLLADVLKRTVSADAISKYARDMRAGRWTLNAETIKRAVDGGILDGRHRLLACVEANASFPSWVAQGVPVEAQRTVDIGRPRSAADQLALSGNANAAALAAVARRSWQWLHGYRGYKMPTPSQTEIDDLIITVPLIKTATTYAISARKEFAAVPVAVYGICYLVFNQAGGDIASGVFLDQVVRADGVSYDQPAAALRRRMIRAGTMKERLKEAEKFALFICAWNGFAEERTMETVQLPKGGLRAANFPVPSGLKQSLSPEPATLSQLEEGASQHGLRE